MCRVLSYLGQSIPVGELLYNPDNSFIKQSYNPHYMSHLLNLAGFGLLAWDHESYHSQLPFLYKTSRLPFYDDNLKNLAAKIKPYCLLAHLRGVPYRKKQIVSNQNVHPFLYDGLKIALAHNGSLSNFSKMKSDLYKYISPEYSRLISGTTDSEWMYALFLTQLRPFGAEYGPEQIIDALNGVFKILMHVRKINHINITSPVNLFISDGKFLAATRFTLDFGWHPLDEQFAAHYAYHSLWYTYGENYGFHDGEYRMKNGNKRSCIIIASEPLTEDTTTWIELPEYTALVAWLEDKEVKIVSKDIVL